MLNGDNRFGAIRARTITAREHTMSYVIDLVSKVHERQLEAAEKGQESVLGLLDRASQVLDRAPKAPEGLQHGIKPIVSALGRPADYVRFAASSSKDWAKRNESFQDALVDLLAPQQPVASAPSSSPSRSSASKKSASSKRSSTKA